MHQPSARKTFVVIDSGRFLGPEISRILGELDHQLVLHAPDEALLTQMVSIGADYVTVSAEEVPLGGPGSIATAEGSDLILSRCLDRFGSIDGAVLRSGNFVSGGLWEVDQAGFESLVDNLRIAAHSLRTFAGELARRGGGSLLMCTSAHPLRPDPGLGLYAALRAAENSLMRSTALSVADRGVTINAIATNFMRFPEFRGGWRDEFETEFGAEIPTSRFGSMTELAAFCVPLLEGRARHLTGQAISWSGGWA